MPSSPTYAVAVAAAKDFLGTFRTLILASADVRGTPQASYAPFVRADEDTFYIYVSRLARHTANLAGSSQVSVLFIEDEQTSEELFARRRLTLCCAVQAIDRESSLWHEKLDLFEKKFGEVATLIRPIEDFVLFALAPKRATYVEGFAKAYTFEGALLQMLLGCSDAVL